MKLLYVILFTFLISTFSFAQWERTNGPEGISITSLANLHNVLYAGTRTDGVYASTDEGISWFALNNGIETKEITAITSINDTLLIGTYNYGVYHSTDGGQTWLLSSNYNSNISVLAMVVKDQYVFASTSEGLLRSSDGGVTWEDISFLPFYESVTEMCATGDKLIATDFTNTYASTDNGENWNVIQSVGYEIFSLYAKGDTVFAGSRNKIYRSLDGGDTFIEIEISFDYSLVNVNSFAYIGQTLFLGTTYANGVYKSTDNGAFWDPASEGMGPKDVRALAVTQSSNLIAGTHYAGVYRSIDQAENWNKSMEGFPAGSSILTLVNAESGVYAGTRDGIYKSTDNGFSWNKLTGVSDTINYSEIRGIAVDGSDIYTACTYRFHGTVYKSTDYGQSWHRSDNGLPSDATFLWDVDISGETVLAATDQGLYYSTDKGQSWLPSNINESIIKLAVTENYVYGILVLNNVYRSANDGVTWNVVLNSPSTSFTSLTAKDNYVYVGDFAGGAFYSDDNGNNWYFGSGPSVYTIKFIPAVPGMVLAGTGDESSYIYASFNYSHNFSYYSEGLGVHAITEALASNSTYSFAGTDYNGVWRRFLPGITPVELTSFTATSEVSNVRLKWQTETETNNSGFQIERLQNYKISTLQNWDIIGFIEGHGTTTEEHEYSFVDENISAGEYQYRLKQIDYDGSFKFSDMVDINISQPTEFSLEQNYPNPFNPSTTIQYSIPEGGNVKLKVYNSLGEEVADLIDDYKEAGNYKINFNASELSSGIYFYQLKSKNFLSIKKMILLK